MRDPSRENEKLRRILAVATEMAVTPDLDALLHVIVDATCQVLDCERATIFLYDAGSDELFSRVARGMAGIRFPASRGIAGAAAKGRIVVNVPDAYEDARFNREVDRATGFRTRNLLTFPLENLAGDLIGVLQALNKRDGAFSVDDEELARVLSAQAGVALDRGRLIEEYAIKQRMARDLDIARDIQRGFLPRKQPQVLGYDVAGWNRPADETGGDCYDFIPLPDGRLVILLADATGHGIGPALIIGQCRSLIRAMFSVTDDLPAIVDRVNRLLCDDLTDNRFVTAFLGVLDPRRHCVEYISNGQGPLLHISADAVDMRGASALPLAIVPDAGAELERFELKTGDLLALLTDGFYETMNSRDEEFGDARTTDLLRTHRDRALTDVIAELHRAVCDFRQDRSQADDLTAILVRRAAGT